MNVIEKTLPRGFAAGFLATGLLLAAASLPYVHAGTITAVSNVPTGSVSYNGQLAPVKANDGNFYGIRGTTFYKFTPAGVYSSVATFSVGNATSLIKGSDGNLYGTTSDGGTNSDGTVFQITPAGVATVLASLDTSDTGSAPANLLQASTGEFYGFSAYGSYGGYGGVFKLENVSSTWMLSLVSDFNSYTGFMPSSLIEASDGYLYGTAQRGGSNGDGTIFKLDLSTSHLYSIFQFGDYPFYDAAGRYPAYIVEKEPGKFLGMTNSGGYYDRGVIYSFTEDGGYSYFIDLGEDYLDEPGEPNDGGYFPNGSPVLGTDGKLYGTMSNGGNFYSLSQGGGTLYRLTYNFSNNIYNYETLVEFSNSSVGWLPQETLVHDGSGKFYGTTTQNTSSTGAIFKFTP